MNILCVVESGTWVEHQILGALRDDGHTVHVYSYGPAVGEFYPRTRRGAQQQRNAALLGMAAELSQNAGLDLIFCYVYDDFLQIETAKALRKLGVPLVNYNVDMATQWYRQICTAPYFDRMLCAEPVNMQLLARYNPRTRLFPMAARVPLAAPADALCFQPSAPVTFLGTPMPFRTALLSHLHKAGIPLAVYGRGWLNEVAQAEPIGWEKTVSDIWHYSWPKLRSEGIAGIGRVLRRRLGAQPSRITTAIPRNICHGFLSDTQVQALFDRSEINLGLTRTSGDDIHVRGNHMIKLRDFEVPMAGGFYLVEYARGYEDFFRIGTEVETWKTPGELLEKTRYYLRNPEKRRPIAAAGRERALRDHTWRNRFDALFTDLGLSG